MKVTIVGGGNIGTQFAVHAAEKGHAVTVYTSKPHLFGKDLSVVDAAGQVLHRGTLSLATDRSADAFREADVVFITLPATCMEDIAATILPFARPGLYIGLIPGTGGGECAFAGCIDKGATLFGLQRVPSVARLVEYGHSVCATGYRDTLHVAALPRQETPYVAAMMADLFDKTCLSLPCYLNLTLTPSNPILHTTRLRTVFADYTPGKTYPSLPLFYEGWSDETSRLLFLCDGEVQALCRTMTAFDLSEVRSLRLHYESPTPEALTAKIRSIPGFRGLTTPHIKTDDGYLPDLHSRYFTADFSFGLAIIQQIARFYGVDVPHIDETMAWYEALRLESDTFSYAHFGITDRRSFEAFYAR